MGILQEEENVGDVSLLAAASWPKIPWRMLYIDGVDTHAEGAPACVCVCVCIPRKKRGNQYFSSSLVSFINTLPRSALVLIHLCCNRQLKIPPPTATHRHPPPP